MTPSIVFDLAMLALLVLVAVLYARRGFAAGLVQFVGNLASLIGALVFSRQAAPVLFEEFFRTQHEEEKASAEKDGSGGSTE